MAAAGLVAAVQAAKADLVAAGGAVLVAGGGFALESDEATKIAVQWCVHAFARAGTSAGVSMPVRAYICACMH
jgi:hypothetical protein